MKKIIILLISVFMLALPATSYANAVEDSKEANVNKDKWIEIQSVVIPFDLTVNSGTTSSGNQKYWFTFENIGNISISVTNYKKYSEKSEYIELVKWQKGNRYKYTTRAKGKSNIDLTKMFKNNLEF